MAEEVKILKIKRGHIKGRLTRFSTFLESLQFTDKAEIIELESRLEKNNETYSEFDEVQDEIEILENTQEQMKYREVFGNDYFKLVAEAKLSISQMSAPIVHPVNMDTRKPLHDNELADILTSEDFWADEEITIEDEAGPSGSQCMSADDEMDATNIILLDGDKSEQGESDHELFSVHDTDSEDDEWVPEKDENWRANTEYSGSENDNSNEQYFGINDDIEETMGRRFFYGRLNKKTAKPCMKWAQQAPVRGRERAENIHTILPGLKGPARENPPSESPLQAWRLIISDDILAEIVINTNKKIEILANSKTHHMCNAEVYTGKEINKQPKSSKQFKEKSLSHPTQVVMRITEPFYHSKRNLTADNWYTSIEAARMLEEKSLTFVRTMKNNNLLHFYHPKLENYVPKQNKSVILLSSMHHDDRVDNTIKKPDIILFYNSTKAGVDALDEKCANYSTSRRSRKWPTTVFYCILNISGVNSRVLYQFARHGGEISRYNYLKELGSALCYQHVHTRINNNFIPRKIRDRAADIFGIQFTYSQRAGETQGNKKRKRCGLCPPKEDEN
ncbi:hypothetical protein JTB14_009350 [Gonioctena quinquepunctata]|nr:hypothetical protein JTB14_009350 [Gonioctena quinquepunctata]